MPATGPAILPTFILFQLEVFQAETISARLVALGLPAHHCLACAQVADLPLELNFAVLILPDKSKLSRKMQDFWQELGVILLFGYGEFMQQVPLAFWQSLPAKKHLAFLSVDGHKWRQLKALMPLFGHDFFQEEPISSRHTLRTWHDIPFIQDYEYKYFGHRPLLLLDLDLPNLHLKSFLHSLNDVSWEVKTDKVYLKPVLLPFKNFDQGVLWNEVISGLKRHCKTILSYNELLHYLVELGQQQENRQLFLKMEGLANHIWPVSFGRTSLPDCFNQPELYQQSDRLFGQNKNFHFSLAELHIPMIRHQYLYLGLRWLFQPSTAP